MKKHSFDANVEGFYTVAIDQVKKLDKMSFFLNYTYTFKFPIYICIYVSVCVLKTIRPSVFCL